MKSGTVLLVLGAAALYFISKQQQAQAAAKAVARNPANPQYTNKDAQVVASVGGAISQFVTAGAAALAAWKSS